MTTRVGIDFGGVIIRNRKLSRDEDTYLAEPEGEEIAQPGVFETVRDIVKLCDGHVWIVSKGGHYIQRRTLSWLERVDFFKRTGLASDHIRFCRERQEKEKLCRELEISHFVDDRVHVMQILRHTVPYLYMFGEQGGKRFCPPWATYISAWADLSEIIAKHIQKDNS
jgi:hypothetical protein